jgi:hypothetical protein
MMNTPFACAECPGYLRVTATGSWTRESAEQLLDVARRQADCKGFDRILLDLRQWDSPDTEMTRFWSGLRLAQLLAQPFRVVAIARAEAITRFGENVARLEGADFRLFTDEGEALAWLHQGR